MKNPLVSKRFDCQETTPSTIGRHLFAERQTVFFMANRTRRYTYARGASQLIATCWDIARVTRGVGALQTRRLCSLKKCRQNLSTSPRFTAPRICRHFANRSEGAKFTQ